MPKQTSESRNPADLANTLARIAHEQGVSLERLRAEQLLADTTQAWPGELEVMWAKWLAEALRSLGLRGKVVRLPLSKALELVEDGALLVCKPAGMDDVTLVLSYDGQNVEITSAGSDERVSIADKDLVRFVDSTSEIGNEGFDVEWTWLIAEDLEISAHDSHNSHEFHDRPLARLVALVRPEWSDIWVVGVFAFFAGVLSLATPIAVESLVNIVAFGRLLQPLMILSLMLFGFLAFASMMRALQTFVVEIIQRRLFARVAADLAYRFPRITADSLHGHYGPEMANRFFDIVTLQKVVAQLLLDGLAIILATTVGMAVLAFYHPWLLGFDVLLLALVTGGVYFLGRGAIASGIDESKQKYRLAAWLEDVIRCQIGFKAAGASDFALDRANKMTADYLAARQTHFRVLFRQLLFILGLQAFAGTVLLGFGGWLVIRGQLTLGQLVAAELIVATILGSLAKLGKHIEGFYDVIASVDKLGHLFDLDLEEHCGQIVLDAGEGACLKITDVKHKKGDESLQRGFSLDIVAGERIALLSAGSAGSTFLFDILYGLQVPESGHVEIEQADPRDLRMDTLRDAVAMVRGIELFDGTIAENIQLAKPGVSMTDVRTALHTVGLLDDVLRLPDGLDTKINATGQPLQPTQLQLLMLARAIAARPRLLLIDGSLDLLADGQLIDVCDKLLESPQSWTLLVATNRRDVADQFARIVDLEQPPSTSRPALTYASPDMESL